MAKGWRGFCLGQPFEGLCLGHLLANRAVPRYRFVRKIFVTEDLDLDRRCSWGMSIRGSVSGQRRRGGAELSFHCMEPARVIAPLPRGKLGGVEGAAGLVEDGWGVGLVEGGWVLGGEEGGGEEEGQGGGGEGAGHGCGSPGV